MWDSIAHTQLGSVSFTGDLLRANMRYKDYFIFPAGITLTLPEVDTAQTASSLPPWKQ